MYIFHFAREQHENAKGVDGGGVGDGNGGEKTRVNKKNLIFF